MQEKLKIVRYHLQSEDALAHLLEQALLHREKTVTGPKAPLLNSCSFKT